MAEVSKSDGMDPPVTPFSRVPTDDSPRNCQDESLQLPTTCIELRTTTCETKRTTEFPSVPLDFPRVLVAWRILCADSFNLTLCFSKDIIVSDQQALISAQPDARKRHGA